MPPASRDTVRVAVSWGSPMLPAAIEALKRKLGNSVAVYPAPLSDVTVRALVSMSLDGRIIYCSGWANGNYIRARAYGLKKFSNSSAIILEQIYS